MQATRTPLPGERWHFQHGPIDLVIGAEGEAAALAAAHQAAWHRMQTILAELVAELPRLRLPVTALPDEPDEPDELWGGLRGPVARRMVQACRPFAPVFITPMAAVAGAVAEELIEAYRGPGIRRAWINNGGDAAFHLSPGQTLRVGLFSDLSRMAELAARGGPALDGAMAIGAGDGVAGLATSGWRGRSFSLGIADSVTVLAASASQADAAATMIANAVDVDAPGIVRRPACELRDDTDLGERLVTVQVPRLTPGQQAAALRAGLAKARHCLAQGLIRGAALVCQDAHAQVGLCERLQPLEGLAA